MTYSTCSFHPIENEAVVAALLATGCVKLVSCDTSRALRGIRRRPGLTHWKVLDDDCQEVFDDGSHPDWPKTLWPSSDVSQNRVLQRCIRMLPQDNDTGGFFIALLKKVKDFPEGKKNGRNKTRMPCPTPQALHHKLFPVAKSAMKDGVRTVTRGPSGGGKTFALSDPLAKFLTESPGSAKVNLVYGGCMVDK